MKADENGPTIVAPVPTAPAAPTPAAALTTPVAPHPPRESIADLFKRLIDDIVALVRSELRLARSEVAAKIREALGSVAAIAVGGVFALVAMTCLMVTGVVALAEHVGLVWATLIFAGVFGLIAVILIVGGIGKLQQMDLAPRRAVANLKKDTEVLKGD